MGGLQEAQVTVPLRFMGSLMVIGFLMGFFLCGFSLGAFFFLGYGFFIDYGCSMVYGLTIHGFVQVGSCNGTALSDAW